METHTKLEPITKVTDEQRNSVGWLCKCGVGQDL